MKDKGVHTFSKVICLKENVIERLEFELADFEPWLQYKDSPQKEKESKYDKQEERKKEKSERVSYNITPDAHCLLQ